MNVVMYSSKRDDWGTPQSLFDALNGAFRFTLDPCANYKNHKCIRYYDKNDDGLTKSWKNERVFCNPPYGREISKWVKKCYDECTINNALVVALLPARTDTKWFHQYVLHHAEIKFIEGRLKFDGGKYPAPFPSMIVYFYRKGDPHYDFA